MAKETEIKILLTLDGKQTQASLKLTDDQVVKLKNSLKGLGGMDSQMKGFATTLKGVAGAMGIAFGAREIFNLLKSTVEEVNRFEQVSRELDATLHSTGFAAGLTSEEIIKLAAHLEELNRFAFDDKDIIDASGLLLTFTKINKEIFPQTMQLALDLSTRFKQDLKSSIVQIGKALNDPIAGVTALSRVGVQFNEEQKKQIKAFVESNNLMSAQGVILDELTKQVGGSAAASVTDHQLKVNKMNESWETFSKTIGPIVSGTFDRITDKIGGAVTVLDTIIAKLKELVNSEEGEWMLKVLSFKHPTTGEDMAQKMKEMGISNRGLTNDEKNKLWGHRKNQADAFSKDIFSTPFKIGGVLDDSFNRILNNRIKTSEATGKTVDELKAELALLNDEIGGVIAGSTKHLEILKQIDAIQKKLDPLKKGNTKDKPEHPEILTGTTEDWLLDDANVRGVGNQPQGPASKDSGARFGVPAWQTMFGEGGANSMTAGVNAFWDNFINKQREAKNGWDAIWLAMKDSALKQLRDIITSQLWNMFLKLFLNIVSPGLGSFGGSAISSIAGPAGGPMSKISAGGSEMNNLSAMMDSKLDRFAAILEAKQFRVRGEDIETTQTVIKQKKSTYGL